MTVDAKFHQGVWIDIFPLDEMPREKSLKYSNRISLLNIIAIYNDRTMLKGANNLKKLFIEKDTVLN